MSHFGFQFFWFHTTHDVLFRWLSRQRFKTIYRITTLLKFLEMWKCKGIWLRSGKGLKSAIGRGICVVWNLIVAGWQLNKITYLYVIRTVICFFVQDVCGEFGIINVHLYDNFIWKVGAGGVGDTFHLESGNSVLNGYICALFVSERGVRCCQYVCAWSGERSKRAYLLHKPRAVSPETASVAAGAPGLPARSGVGFQRRQGALLCRSGAAWTEDVRRGHHEFNAG